MHKTPQHTELLAQVCTAETYSGSPLQSVHQQLYIFGMLFAALRASQVMCKSKLGCSSLLIISD